MGMANAKKRKVYAAVIGALILAWGAAAPVRAASYPQVPIAQYRMDRTAEIALARSAAPPSISGDATVLVLGAAGYEVAAQGKNGFTCLVEHSWNSSFDDPEFWNPKIVAPICFNAAATKSVLPDYLGRTKGVIAGASVTQIHDRIRAEVASGLYGVPAPGSMCFMMAKGGYLSDAAGGHWQPHLMYFLPKADAAAWGANLPGSPVMAAQGDPEPVTVYFVPVPAWSDGTMAPMGM